MEMFLTFPFLIMLVLIGTTLENPEKTFNYLWEILSALVLAAQHFPKPDHLCPKTFAFYLQVVLQRANLRTGEEEEKEADGQMFQLQLAQLVGVAVLLCAMYVTILIKICKIITEICSLKHSNKTLVLFWIWK